MGISAIKPGDYVSVYADLDRKCTRGLVSSYKQSKYFIGNGFAKMCRRYLYNNNARPTGIAVQMTDIKGGMPCLKFGCVPNNVALLQNLPSVLCCRLLNPHPGETILDMCAAPGNKTTFLATLMSNKGTIIALDKTNSKIECIKKRCEQFSIDCVQQFVYDATQAVIEMPLDFYSGTDTKEFSCSHRCNQLHTDNICQNQEMPRELSSDIKSGPPFKPEVFDRILLDVPCSALGQRPQLSNYISVKQLKSYPPLQRKLFTSAVSLLKPNGRLVYSTCTITVAENEHIVLWALNKFPSLRLLPIDYNLGGPGFPNVGLSEEQRNCVRRFGPPVLNASQTLPSHYDYSDDTVGFFIACFTKC